MRNSCHFSPFFFLQIYGILLSTGAVAALLLDLKARAFSGQLCPPPPTSPFFISSVHAEVWQWLQMPHLIHLLLQPHHVTGGQTEPVAQLHECNMDPNSIRNKGMFFLDSKISRAVCPNINGPCRTYYKGKILRTQHQTKMSHKVYMYTEIMMTSSQLTPKCAYCVKSGLVWLNTKQLFYCLNGNMWIDGLVLHSALSWRCH